MPVGLQVVQDIRGLVLQTQVQQQWQLHEGEGETAEMCIKIL